MCYNHAWLWISNLNIGLKLFVSVRLNIKLWVQSSHFSTDHKFINGQETQALIYPSQDTRDIIAAAVSLQERLWRPHVKYSKSGIILSEFFPSG